MSTEDLQQEAEREAEREVAERLGRMTDYECRRLLFYAAGYRPLAVAEALKAWDSEDRKGRT